MDLFASASLLFLSAFVGCFATHGILPEGPVDAVLGRNVTLTTLLDKPAFAFITWSFSNGQDQTNVATLSKTDLKANPPFVGRVAINASNGNLFLGDLRSEDSGDYSITVIKDDATTLTSEIQLRVLEPVSDVVIMSNLAEAIEHNSTVVLTCSAKGSFLTFTWINGTAPVVDGKRFAIKAGELSATLTITGVLRSDLTLPISCKATNKLEAERSAPFNLTVYYGPDEVAIAPPSPPEFIQSDSNFSLSCSAVSSPAATFSWFHDGQPIKHSGPTLTLDVIRALGLGKKTGQYMCQASNDKTKRAVASAAVSFALMEPISGVEVTGPTAVLFAGNSSANLSCQATSGGVATAAWLKDGTPLAPSARLVFAEEKRSLTIETLQKEDNGVYTCQLSNPVSKGEASYKMEVVYGPEAVTVTGESAVEVNEKVVLTCSVASVPPANFTWKFNGTKTDVKTATYTIEKAVYKNTGTYTCEAYNAVTGKTVVSSRTLAVKEEGSLDEGLSDGAIAGIVIAVLIALGAAIGLIFYCRQKVPVESPY